MALVQRQQNPFAPKHVQLYMLLDVTKIEDTKCLLVADMQRVQLLGKLKAAEGIEGRKLLAPPLEGRGFSKLEKLQLQYLYWNTTGKTPTEDYQQLVQECIAAFKELTPNDDPVHSLQFLVDQIEASAPGTVVVDGVVHKPGVDNNAPPARPSVKGVTGVIWQICDEVLQALHQGIMPADLKPLRAEAWKRCDNEGFNSGTFGVQYGKWKNNKLASISGAEGGAKE